MTTFIENQSRLVRKPIPNRGVNVCMTDQTLVFKQGSHTKTLTIPEGVHVELQDDALLIRALAGVEGAKALSGTLAVLSANVIEGITQGFQRALELKGVGYRAKLDGKTLVLTLGKSHEDRVEAPEGVTFTVPSATEIVVAGADKQQVGQVAANIRSLRPPEPYKGKGIRYRGEVIITKEVKKKSA